MRCLPISVLIALLGVSLSWAEPIAIVPSTVLLSSTAARQLLVVQRVQDAQLAGQLGNGIAWESSDPNVVRVENNFAIPVGNGAATLTARLGDAVAQAHVEVTGQDTPFQWSFRNHVESVLSKAGCNGGACHGARAGKNGFRLTLFGFDLDADYEYLTRQARARRIVPSDPGRSLLLTKPTGAIPHKGGIRFEVDSLEYRVLAEWIAGGAPSHRSDDPIIHRLEVLPGVSLQQVGARQQLVVLAHFSDGHVEDVTHWAKFTALQQSVAQVDGQGIVEIMGPGEGAIKVWYLNINAMAFLSVPFPNDVQPDVFTQAARRNFIDEHILKKLQSLNLPPSAPCDDATFLRRAFLDTLGVLPTEAETRSFLEDYSPDKRERLIDELLARPEFIDYWSYKWSDLLLASGQRLRPDALAAYSGWIRQQVALNTPWDEFVRRLVTANGSTFENGAANFYALHQEPTEMAETVSQAFLGLAINCAKCHNHPLEKWTNDQYYGFANMFSRVRAKGWGGDFRGGDGLRVVFADTRGELLQPTTGRPQPPRPLDGDPIAPDDTTDRRVHLALWLTSPENPYFTRSIVNRVWANFFGVGLVEKVDDIRATNPASNEELLTDICRYVVEQRYDLKELIRVILQSAAYQRSSEATPGNEPDDRFYARHYPRRLSAEVMLDAVSQATDSPTLFPNQKQGLRALQLSDTDVASNFLSTFGRPDRLITCECERSAEPSMTQALHLYNGDTLTSKLQSAEGRIARHLASGDSDETIVQTAYLVCLSRFPTDAEKKQLLQELAAAPDEERRAGIEDLYWSILTSKEFLFNH